MSSLHNYPDTLTYSNNEGLDDNGDEYVVWECTIKQG